MWHEDGQKRDTRVSCAITINYIKAVIWKITLECLRGHWWRTDSFINVMFVMSRWQKRCWTVLKSFLLVALCCLWPTWPWSDHWVCVRVCVCGNVCEEAGTHRSCSVYSVFSGEICPVTGCRNDVALWLWLWTKRECRKCQVCHNRRQSASRYISIRV